MNTDIDTMEETYALHMENRKLRTQLAKLEEKYEFLEKLYLELFEESLVTNKKKVN